MSESGGEGRSRDEEKECARKGGGAKTLRAHVGKIP